MRVNKYLLPALTILALFGTVLTAKATGVWSVSGKQTIDIQNMQSADDIRGWMTLQQVSDGFGITQPRIYQMLDIPDDIPTLTALKDLESLLPDFEVSGVRDRIAEFLENKTNHSPSGENPLHVEDVGPTPVPPGTRLPGSEIKGRHTLAEISSQCQVSLPGLLHALNLPADMDPSLAAKDLVERGAFPEIQTLRETVSGMQNP